MAFDPRGRGPGTVAVAPRLRRAIRLVRLLRRRRGACRPRADTTRPPADDRLRLHLRAAAPGRRRVLVSPPRHDPVRVRRRLSTRERGDRLGDRPGPSRPPRAGLGMPLGGPDDADRADLGRATVDDPRDRANPAGPRRGRDGRRQGTPRPGIGRRLRLRQAVDGLPVRPGGRGRLGRSRPPAIGRDLPAIRRAGGGRRGHSVDRPRRALRASGPVGDAGPSGRTCGLSRQSIRLFFRGRARVLAAGQADARLLPGRDGRPLDRGERRPRRLGPVADPSAKTGQGHVPGATDLGRRGRPRVRDPAFDLRRAVLRESMVLGLLRRVPDPRRRGHGVAESRRIAGRRDPGDPGNPLRLSIDPWPDRGLAGPGAVG